MCTIIGSKNGEKIEWSAVVEKNKLNVVPKKSLLAIVILISV